MTYHHLVFLPPRTPRPGGRDGGQNIAKFGGFWEHSAGKLSPNLADSGKTVPGRARNLADFATPVPGRENNLADFAPPVPGGERRAVGDSFLRQKSSLDTTRYGNCRKLWKMEQNGPTSHGRVLLNIHYFCVQGRLCQYSACPTVHSVRSSLPEPAAPAAFGPGCLATG